MTSSRDDSMLSRNDPFWIVLGLALLIFAILIVVEISLAPTYIDVRVDMDGYALEWSQPAQTTFEVENQGGWPMRYFSSRRSAGVCWLDSSSNQSLETGLQQWAAANNWVIVNPSLDPSCQTYAQWGLDLGAADGDRITLKPLGWDEGLEWNATLCVSLIEADPCGRVTVTSVVPSFGVMVGER